MRSAILVALVLLTACRQDRDGDGFVGRDDCDDADADVFPGAVERCNGADDDCDGTADEAEDVEPVFFDGDGDGVGAGPEVRACPEPAGHVRVDGDCDDADPAVYPGAAEVCDGVDQDCDGAIDEEPNPPLYVDADADGYGDPDQPVGCVAFAVPDGSDCDDGDAEVFPGADERCNGVDDDCDGRLEEEQDADADGAFACMDCDDADPARSPQLLESCNGIDDDCDGVVDGPEAWFTPEAQVRVRVRVDVPAGSSSPLVVLVDAREALDAAGQVVAFDPTALRAAWQDCDAFVALPVAWVEDETWATGGAGAGVPERGAVVVLYDTDGDLDTVEPWPGDGEIGLYLGVDDGEAWAGGVAVAGTTLSAGGADLFLDEAAGGMAELWEAGELRWSQAQATAGNGIRTGAGPLSAQDEVGTVDVADALPVTAALTTSVGLANAQGGLDASWGYRRFAGRSEVWVKPRFTTARTTTLEGVEERTETVRPWQVVVPGLTGVGASVDLRRALVAAPMGVGWSWWVSPTYLTHVEADVPGEQVWAAANQVAPCCGGTTGSVGAGVELVDGPILRVDVGDIARAPVGAPRAPEGP